MRGEQIKSLVLGSGGYGEGPVEVLAFSFQAAQNGHVLSDGEVVAQLHAVAADHHQPLKDGVPAVADIAVFVPLRGPFLKAELAHLQGDAAKNALDIVAALAYTVVKGVAQLLPDVVVAYAHLVVVFVQAVHYPGQHGGRKARRELLGLAAHYRVAYGPDDDEREQNADKHEQRSFKYFHMERDDEQRYNYHRHQEDQPRRY